MSTDIMRSKECQPGNLNTAEGSSEDEKEADQASDRRIPEKRRKNSLTRKYW